MQNIFPLFYFPPTAWFSMLLQEDAAVLLEVAAFYEKQQYLNRTLIQTSQQPLALVIPIQRTKNKELYQDKKISYDVNWQTHHWRSIVTAYQSSPYFEFYADKLRVFYEKKYTFLKDFNLEILHFCLQTLRIEKEILLTSQYQPSDFYKKDYRLAFPIHAAPICENVQLKPYMQVFGETFVPNLSVLDLICNTGPRGVSFLTK
ncbi:MAG: WbqC family protein [Bacteroidia bacterium]